MKQGSAQPSSSAEALRDTGTEAGGGGRAPRARGEGRGARGCEGQAGVAGCGQDAGKEEAGVCASGKGRREGKGPE